MSVAPARTIACAHECPPADSASIEGTTILRAAWRIGADGAMHLVVRRCRASQTASVLEVEGEVVIAAPATRPSSPLLRVASASSGMSAPRGEPRLQRFVGTLEPSEFVAPSDDRLTLARLPLDGLRVSGRAGFLLRLMARDAIETSERDCSKSARTEFEVEVLVPSDGPAPILLGSLPAFVGLRGGTYVLESLEVRDGILEGLDSARSLTLGATPDRS